MSMMRAIWLAIQSIWSISKYTLISKILSKTWWSFDSNSKLILTSMKRMIISSSWTYQITDSHTLSILDNSLVQQKRNDARKEQNKRVQKRREHNELKDEEKQSQDAEWKWLEWTLSFSTCLLSRIVIFYVSFALKMTLKSWNSVITIFAESVSRSEEL